MSVERKTRIGLAGQIWLWVYGIIAAFFAIMVGGAGHGTITLLQLVGSPITGIGQLGFELGMPGLGSSGNMWGLMVGALQWGVLGTSFSRHVVGRKFFIGFLLLHYAVAAVLLTKFGDWEYARRISLPFLVIAYGFYAAGQLSIWWLILRNDSAPS